MRASRSPPNGGAAGLSPRSLTLLAAQQVMQLAAAASQAQKTLTALASPPRRRSRSPKRAGAAARASSVPATRSRNLSRSGSPKDPKRQSVSKSASSLPAARPRNPSRSRIEAPKAAKAADASKPNTRSRSPLDGPSKAAPAAAVAKPKARNRSRSPKDGCAAKVPAASADAAASEDAARERVKVKGKRLRVSLKKRAVSTKRCECKPNNAPSAMHQRTSAAVQPAAVPYRDNVWHQQCVVRVSFASHRRRLKILILLVSNRRDTSSCGNAASS